MKVKRWRGWALALAAIWGVGVQHSSYASGKTKTATYRLVNNAFITSIERVYFIGTEAFFSDGVNTIVLDSPSGKYKRTLRGVAYPLAVSNGRLYTIKNNSISLVDIKSGSLKKLIDASSLKIDRFVDGSTQEISETTRVLTAFQFDGDISVLSVYYSHKYGCELTVAYNLKDNMRLWKRNSCGDETAPYGGIGVFRGYFVARSGDDQKYYDIKTGKDLDVFTAEKLKNNPYFYTGENDGLRNTPCSYRDNIPFLLCKSKKAQTTYQLIRDDEVPHYDHLIVSSKLE